MCKVSTTSNNSQIAGTQLLEVHMYSIKPYTRKFPGKGNVGFIPDIETKLQF